MIEIDKIINIRTQEEFETCALAIFSIQARRCKPYAEYLQLIKCDVDAVDTVDKIPSLPIEFFKSHKVYCGVGEAEKVFTSSSTGGQEPSRHFMARVGDYEATFRVAFSLFYGSPDDTAIYALLPNYLEREGSSLVYMVNNLIDSGGGGFYLYDHKQLLSELSKESGRKILLGVSYALLDLAETRPPFVENIIVMETGGMKGRREEMPKEEFHAVLCGAFGVDKIHSEYGMAELSSQAYSYGDGVFNTPPWMRVVARDLNDPFELLPEGRSGGVNIIDLANINSCSFIETQDVGNVDAEQIMKTRWGEFRSTRFRILGRIDRSEIRGCNLLVE